MKAIIVPIDFSRNSLEAAQYAVFWCRQLDIQRIILYHSNQDLAQPTLTCIQELDVVRMRLMDYGVKDIVTLVDEEDIKMGITLLTHQYEVAFIVMGITGRSKVGQKLIGSNVLKLSRHTAVPILVVPAGTQFAEIKQVTLALPIIDNLRQFTPVSSIAWLVQTLKTRLMIVNVGKKKDKVPKATLYAGLKDIFAMFEELKPSFEFLTANNTVDSLTDFVHETQPQLLITVAGHTGFRTNLFKQSITKQLVYKSAIPLLIYRTQESE